MIYTILGLMAFRLAPLLLIAWFMIFFLIGSRH